MAGNTLFGGLSLLLTAGACVMIFFIVLAGTKDWSPLNQVYFLWADTSDIDGAQQISEWTLWNVCGSTNSNGGGNTINCGKIRPATPFQPQYNFGTSEGVPSDFLNNPRTYYYLSRFAFSFYLISLFFMLSSLVTGLLALCSRLGSALSALAAAWALFCLTLTAALMTAVYIKGRNAFNDAGLSAGVGVKAFAFTWASVAALLISTVLYCLGFSAARKNHNRRSASYETKETRGRVLPNFFHRRRSPADSQRALA